MNTQTVTTIHKQAFIAALTRLMFEDGFGPDEALGHAVAYAQCVFRKATPTAVLRVECALRVIEEGALRS
jgi:hypothetical protein